MNFHHCRNTTDNLGADFFEHYGFLVDCKNHSIIQSSLPPQTIYTEYGRPFPLYFLHTILHINLLINVKKCEYFASDVQFLGHSISSKGISTILAKLDIIKALPLPKSVINFRSFLGAVNFYNMFIPMASSLLSPSSALAVGPKTAIIIWTDNTKSTFDKVILACEI